MKRKGLWGLASLVALIVFSFGIEVRAQTNIATVGVGAFPTTPDPQTGYFVQVLTVGNPTATNFPGVRVKVHDLPPDTEQTNMVRVANAHGILSIGAETNIAYFDFGPITAGKSIDFQVEYYISNRKLFPTPRYEVNVQAIGTLLLPSTLLVTNNATRFEQGKFFAEFKSDEGKAYFVQYNTSLTATNGWKTSLPNIRGTGDKILWIDDGPPRTESLPTTAGSRFYRVIALPQ